MCMGGENCRGHRLGGGYIVVLRKLCLLGFFFPAPGPVVSEFSGGGDDFSFTRVGPLVGGLAGGEEVESRSLLMVRFSVEVVMYCWSAFKLVRENVQSMRA